MRLARSPTERNGDEMAGINKVIIVGRVGNDPETRSFTNGGEVAEFSVATSDQWKDKETGEKKEKTTWHRIKVLNDGLVKNVIRPFINKGSLIGIEGELTVEEWEKDGQKHYTTKVLVGAFRGTVYLLGDKRDGGGDSADRPPNERSRTTSDQGGTRGGEPQGRQDPRGNFSRDIDDDIPF